MTDSEPATETAENGPSEAAPQPVAAEPAPSGGRLLLELGPLVAFFISNKRYGIIPATGIFMGAALIALVISWRRDKRLPRMLTVTTAFIVAFGALTLVFQDDVFIKLKPTIFNVLAGSALFFGLARGKLYLKFLLEAALPMTDRGWRALTVRYGAFCFLLAALNEFVWRNYSNDAWVNFKVFGIMPLTMVFLIWQMTALKSEMLGEE